MQIKAAMIAAPSPAFSTISTKHDWRAIYEYNCRWTVYRQLNCDLIQRFIAFK